MNIIDKIILRIYLQLFKNSYKMLMTYKLFNEKEKLIIENIIKTIEIDNKISI